MFTFAITFLYLAHPVRLRFAALLLPAAEPVPHELLEVERCAPLRVHLLPPAVLVERQRRVDLHPRLYADGSLCGAVHLRYQQLLP